MDNYFEREIMALEREIRQLKTAQQKSAGQVPTVSHSAQVQIPLRLNSSQTTASGTAIFRVTTPQNSYIVVTLAKYYDNILVSARVPRETRNMVSRLGKIDQNTYLIELLANGTEGANSDVTTLRNGGSVTLENTLTVQCTDEFTLEQIS